MKYLVRNIPVSVYKEKSLKDKIRKFLKLSTEDFAISNISRKSLDARQKRNLKFIYTVIIETSTKLNLIPNLEEYTEEKNPEIEKIKLSNINPFIIGAGPAGYFAALKLVENGFKPYIFDQGDPIEKRAEKVNQFWINKILDENSNVQFGEGGAGAFSDGKLTSRGRSYYFNQVLDYLVKFGAPENIKYDSKPHLGSEVIQRIFKNIRNYLLENGCEIHWRNKLTDFELENEKLKSAIINDVVYSPEILILGVGNSSRKLFENLSNKLAIESKPFAVGFRIEHPQDFLNNSFYGKDAPIDIIGPASYNLAAKYKNRGVYTFCMCPGGFVLTASSENLMNVTNGMSYSKRNGEFGNSALVFSVSEADFGTKKLDGIHYQRMIEKKTFSVTSNYISPVQSVKDYLNDLLISRKSVSSLCPSEYKKLNSIFPGKYFDAIQSALNVFDKKIPGFIENGVFWGTETRTSSPVRILRDKNNYNSISAENLYPIGEGSGYAGGIVSSAADGLRVADQFEI